jgi:hypothetical protein
VNLKKIKLKRGTKILVDFDGTIVEEVYPKFGRILPEARKFLNKCKKHGVLVYIWAARNNSSVMHDGFVLKGGKSVIALWNFLKKNKVYFTDIFIADKPIGHHMCRILIDDNTRPSVSEDFFEFEE